MLVDLRLTNLWGCSNGCVLVCVSSSGDRMVGKGREGSQVALQDARGSTGRALESLCQSVSFHQERGQDRRIQGGSESNPADQ